MSSRRLIRTAWLVSVVSLAFFEVHQGLTTIGWDAWPSQEPEDSPVVATPVRRNKNPPFPLVVASARNVTGVDDSKTIPTNDTILNSVETPSGRPHPHAGALDEHGHPNYVHDVTFLLKRPLNFTYRSQNYSICDASPRQGEEGRLGWDGLAKIQVRDMPPGHGKKILCIVIANSLNHESIRSAAETFGPRCDGFLAASNLTDPTIGAVNILHLGPEHYDNLWQKSRSIWAYVHDHYLEQFDFFHMGPDDSFVIPENLRYMVTHEPKFQNEQQPLYFGSPVLQFPRPRLLYCSGGGGYTLNRRALSMLVKDIFPKFRADVLDGEEDVAMAEAVRQINHDLQCMDTVDDKGEGRYHILDINWFAHWNLQQPTPWWGKALERRHGIVYKEGLEGISDMSISFHLKIQDVFTIARDRGMRRYHAILHGLCGDLFQPATDSTTDDASLAHPHGGARNEHGHLRYIHDTKYLQTHPLNFTFATEDGSICNSSFGQGEEGSLGYQALEKIQLSVVPPENPTRILCIVLTNSMRHDIVRAIAETYGQRCDGFLASSNITDASIGAVHIVHEGEESSDNAWQKVRSTWAYVYSHYLEDYDFFHMAPDTSYLIVDNLRFLATKWEKERSLYFGASMLDASDWDQRYCDGAGYTLNQIALEKFGRWQLRECNYNQTTERHDFMMGQCMKRMNQICLDTNDHVNATRYHIRDLEWRAGWNKTMETPWMHEILARNKTVYSLEGMEGISKTTVSVHLEPKKSRDGGIRRYHAILYGLCKNHH